MLSKPSLSYAVCVKIGIENHVFSLEKWFFGGWGFESQISQVNFGLISTFSSIQTLWQCLYIHKLSPEAKRIQKLKFICEPLGPTVLV